MTNGHWTEEELIGRLYETGPEEPARQAHLAACPECAARWSELAQKRGALVQGLNSMVVDESRLRAQRDAVWRRLEGTRRPWLWRAVPTGATALVLLFAVMFYRPASLVEPKPASVAHQISDDELFKEIAAMVNEDAPRVTQPIQGLFDEQAAVEVQ